MNVYDIAFWVVIASTFALSVTFARVVMTKLRGLGRVAALVGAPLLALSALGWLTAAPRDGADCDAILRSIGQDRSPDPTTRALRSIGCDRPPEPEPPVHGIRHLGVVRVRLPCLTLLTIGLTAASALVLGWLIGAVSSRRRRGANPLRAPEPEDEPPQD